MTGIVSNIQRFSLHDGPGARATVFFKGCPLRCLWCHNPETYAFGRELRYKRADCVFCGACIKACPNNALSITPGAPTPPPAGDEPSAPTPPTASKATQAPDAPPPGDPPTASEGTPDPAVSAPGEAPTLTHQPALCDHCFACARECPTGALAVSGMEMTVEDVLKEVLRDAAMYARTGGGVTLSGGEASAQYEFALALTEALKRQRIHVALDTCGVCDQERLTKLAALSDLVLFDLKHADPDAHRELTGADNRLILRNLRALGETGTPVEVRVPIIPTYNDDEENLAALAKIVSGHPHVKTAVLLGYHPLGRAKIYQFDEQGRSLDITPPGKARLQALAEGFQTLSGVPVSYR